jgi:mono/diheme cytochrome c family protein
MTLGLHPSTAGVLLLLAVLGCGGEQRSGAAPATDTTPTLSSDTAAKATSDTAPPARDTTASAGRTDTAAPRDTARTNVATKPAPKKTQRSRPAPAPRADTIRTDTSRADSAPSPTAAPAPQTNTSTTTSQSSDTGSTSTQTAQANAPLRDQYHRAPLDTVPQQVYDGWKQYNLNCARCHGEDVQGTTIAPHLIVSVKPDGPINTKENFVQTVCAGRPEKGMPAWCPLGMEMPTIEAIYSYVKGRSEGKIRPGRPALRSGG